MFFLRQVPMDRSQMQTNRCHKAGCTWIMRSCDRSVNCDEPRGRSKTAHGISSAQADAERHRRAAGGDPSIEMREQYSCPVCSVSRSQHAIRARSRMLPPEMPNEGQHAITSREVGASGVHRCIEDVAAWKHPSKENGQRGRERERAYCSA